MANLSWHWYRRDRIGLLIAVEYINANDTIALRKKIGEFVLINMHESVNLIQEN